VEISNRNIAKVLAGVIGGGALVTMGVLTAAAGSAPAGSPSTVAGPMTVGVTSTVTTPEATLATSVAVPPVKATAFK
jgi:hypothetical protein